MMHPASGFWIAAKWPWVKRTTMTSQFADMMSSSIFFWRLCVSLVNFSFWSKFHVNIVTGSGVKTIFVYKGCDQKCGKFCPISGDWGYQFELNVCNENFLNAAKFQVYRFYLFWVIELKTPGRVGVKILPLDQG